MTCTAGYGRHNQCRPFYDVSPIKRIYQNHETEDLWKGDHNFGQDPLQVELLVKFKRGVNSSLAGVKPRVVGNMQQLVQKTTWDVQSNAFVIALALLGK